MDLLSRAWQFRWEEITAAVTGTMAPWQHLKDGISPFSLSLLPFLHQLMDQGMP